jgi:hypothetical protein
MQPLHLLWFWIAGGVGLLAMALYLGVAPAGNLPATGVGDTVEHASCFLVLTFWFSGIASARFHLPLGVALFLFGVALEWAQYATARGRVADLGDLGANSIGIALGLSLAAVGLGDWMRWVETRLLRR